MRNRWSLRQLQCRLPTQLFFISFGGVNTRENFVSFLDQAFRNKGIDHFIKWGLSLPRLSGLGNLEELDLTNCAIAKVPDTVGSLSSLKELYLGRNNFETLPASLRNLCSLQYLDISYCKVLQSLPDLPLMTINAYDCTSLEAIPCLLVPHSVDCIDSTFVKVDLINCLKVVGNSVIHDTLLKMQSLATLWKNTYSDDQVCRIHYTSMLHVFKELPHITVGINGKTVWKFEL